ncbi:MAG: lactate racemase domain-containing protein [Myxococcota bacterium]
MTSTKVPSPPTKIPRQPLNKPAVQAPTISIPRNNVKPAWDGGIVHTDKNSPPRVLYYGDDFRLEHLPVGTRVIFPKPPMAALNHPDAAIRYALNHPEEDEPLYAKLFPGMTVTIAIDDISLPLPPMKRPDIRERILNILLQILGDHGVTDIEIVIATSFHRRMKDWEVRHIVGDKVFNAYWPDRLYNHDAEDEGMEVIGKTERGEVVELPRRVLDSDLLIYVNINLVPMDGGNKSVAVGLAGYKSLRAHHNPMTMRECHSYMDPERSSLHDSTNRMGKLVNQHCNVFHIETAINNNMYGGQLSFLMKREEDFTDLEWMKFKGLMFTLSKLPSDGRTEIFSRIEAPYEMIGVWAGKTEPVHRKCLERVFQQYAIPVKGQADIAIMGMPFISPYNVHSILNPVLVQVLAQGYMHNLYRGVPLVKKGGTLIISHPAEDRFDAEQHPSYIEFFHRLLPITKDSMTLHKKYEEEFAQNPIYRQMYRRGHAYHGVHPFYMWYWGEAGRQHMGRIIVAGAKSESVCRILGYEPARNLSEAVEMAKDTAPRSPNITMVHAPPILVLDVEDPTVKPLEPADRHNPEHHQQMMHRHHEGNGK